MNRKTSPTQRSLQLLRSRDYPLVQVVEKWIAPIKKRQDLFGIIDILCIAADGATIAVQTTTGGEVSPHLQKMLGSLSLPIVLEAGWKVELHGWRKVCKERGSKIKVWKPRIIDFQIKSGVVNHTERNY